MPWQPAFLSAVPVEHELQAHLYSHVLFHQKSSEASLVRELGHNHNSSSFFISPLHPPSRFLPLVPVLSFHPFLILDSLFFSTFFHPPPYPSSFSPPLFFRPPFSSFFLAFIPRLTCAVQKRGVHRMYEGNL